MTEGPGTAEVTVVVGLGNPGPRYAGNRHNVGALVVDELADRVGGGRVKAPRAGAAVLGGRRPGHRLVLPKPRSFMTVSGGPVAGLARSYKVAPENIVVVYDELDIPFPTVRLNLGGAESGHNGLRS